MERDENDLDGDGSHPQKHAKSPELAREFLLDAAAVIFKEQVIDCQNHLKSYWKQNDLTVQWKGNIYFL